MRVESWLVVALELCWTLTCDAANVLVWSPLIGYSHVTFLGRIADILHDDGHNVTIFQPEGDPDCTSSGAERVRSVLVHRSEHFRPADWLSLDWKSANVWTIRGDPITARDYARLHQFHLQTCNGLVTDLETLNSLRVLNFSVAIIEPYDYCAAGIFKLIGVESVITVSTVGMTPHTYKLTGLPCPSSFVPAFAGPFSDKMSLWERARNMLMWFRLFRFYDLLERDEHQIFTTLVSPNFPNLESLYKETLAYAFLNVNEFTATVRPTMPKVKQIGGVAYRPPKPIKQPFSSIYAKASKGVVLFSIGSLVRSQDIPARTQLEIASAFAEFGEYEFVWKHEQADHAATLFANFSNIHFVSWIPQIDLLAQNSTRAFITHGGMNSLIESVFSGVPLIAIPVFADQYANSAVAERRGYGIRLLKQNVDKEHLVIALQRILGDGQHPSSYTLAARKARRLLRGRHEEVIRNVKRWVRDSVEFGQLEHLDLYGRDFSFVVFHNVDVIALVAFAALLAVAFVASLAACLYRCIARRLQTASKKHRTKND